MRNKKRKKPFITGYYGCSCHPYESWADLKHHEQKKVKQGQKVMCRCTKREGVVYSVKDKGINGWCIVKYGPLPKNHELEHTSTLFIL